MLPCLLVLSAVLYDDGKPEASAKERPYWLEVAKSHLDECRVFPETDREHPYQILPEPVFHHIQATRAKSVGSVFLFLEQSGRPAAVGDVFLFPRGKKHQLYNEWHSLAAEPIAIQWNDRNLLATPGPGLKWNDFPEAPAPVAGRPERERQLRQLARRFTGHLVNQKKDRFELRLLTTPLYQYHAADIAGGKSDFLTGGFFAFCQETDPEIFLLIEARRSDRGPKWVYAAAEFSNLNLFLELDGKEVWSANPPSFDSRGPHWGGYLHDVDLAAPGQK